MTSPLDRPGTRRTRAADAPIWSLPLGAPAAGETLQGWLYRTLRQAILGGRLGAGTRLPGTRALAQQQRIARGTVQAAYDQLLSEGYLDAVHGSGTRVAAMLPERSLEAPLQAGAAPVPAPPPPAPVYLTASLDGLGAAFPLQPPGATPPPFHPHRCDVDAFPVDLWRRLHMRHLRRSHPAAFGDVAPAGLPALRAAIAAHLHVARGVDVPPEQIVVVASVQQALDICLRLLVGPGESVWMEDPGYPGARQLMHACGARVVDVAVDADGMRVADGIRAAPRARLAYVTPARQAPLGMALAPQRRLALLDWAAGAGAYVFEDDYDSEYRFVAKPIPALRSHPGSAQHVILAGTFSKLLFPGIRLAFVALPRHLVDRFVRAFSLTARNANGLGQAVLADFMAEGHFDRHVRRMRRLYATRALAFADAARHHWHGLIEVATPEAGLDVVGRLVGIDEDAALARLQPAGLTGFPLGRYYGAAAQLPPGLVMGFAPFDAAAIEDGARRIAQALRGKT